MFLYVFIDSDCVNICSYFEWAMFDTFEFQTDNSENWGLYHVKFNHSLKGIPTHVAKWYKEYFTCNLIVLN